MGMFDSAPVGAEGVIDSGVEVEADRAAANEPAEYTPPEPQKTEHVPLPKPSRRQAAAQQQQDVIGKLTALETKFTSELSQRDQVIAELRGRLSATEPLMQRAAQPPVPQGPPEETPDQLRAKAREHLDKSEVREYERLMAEATKREVMAEVKKLVPAQQPQASPGTDPRLIVLMAQHPEVTQHPAGIQIATMEDGILAAQGVPNGPERWARAFQMAKARIGGTTTAQPQGFTTQAAGALAAVPTGQPAARAAVREPGVELTDYEKNVARIAGMSLDEYAKGIAERFPHRVVR